MKSLFTFISILLLSSFSLADAIYVAPVNGTNVSQGETSAVRELIISHIQGTEHTVVNSENQADYFLQSKLIKFANYTLSMSKWKGTQKMKSGQWMAESSAQLESSTQKAVANLVGGVANSKNSSSSLGQKVAQHKQAQSGERVTAPRQVLFGFGPAFFNNMNSSDSGLALALGYYWNINDNVDLGLHTDFAFSTEDSDTNMLTAKIMANYFPILLGDTSPYIGAGFGYGYASAHTDSKSTLGVISSDRANGFAASLQAGVKFFRTSSVNLGVGVDYTTIFDKTTNGNPSRFIFNVGLFF